MAKLFEAEVRFLIEDIENYRRHLRTLGAKLLFRYEFEDFYYQPEKENWNLLKKNLRIRRWLKPKKKTAIYFSKNEVISFRGLKFKRSLYPYGKVSLFKGDFEICKQLLEDLGFRFWFLVKKENCYFWDLPKFGFRTIAEYIRDLGWTGELEFEGKDPQVAKEKIVRALEILNIPAKKASFEPVSLLVAKRRGFL